jgi:sulfite exporter TauE/SafE
MVGTIGPIVNGESKSGQLPVTLWVHSLGYVLGSASLGALLGGIGAVLVGSRMLEYIVLITGFLSLILGLRDLALVPVSLPRSRKQVPSNWLVIFPPRITAFLYGAGLGLGVLTYIPLSTLYVAVVWVTLRGSPLTGALGMAFFGLGRALPMIWLSNRPDGYGNSGYLGRALPSWKPLAQLISGLALGFSGACLVVASFN